MFIKKLSVLVLVLIFSLGCGTKEEKQDTVKKEVPKKEVEVYVVKDEKVPIWIEFSGKTKAYQNVDVIARVKGILEKKFFKAGDIVKKGDLLFKIEDSQYSAILEQKEASKKKNEASLKLAISSLERYKPLVEKELATREKLDQLIAQKEEIEALIKANMSEIKQAKLNLEYTNVRASIDGIIGKAMIDVGNVVGGSSESSKLATIVRSNPLYVNFTPSGYDTFLINKYKSEKNPKVKVFIPSRKEIKYYEGNVDFIDNKTNDSTGTVSMRAVIDNPDYSLLPGTFVQIKLFISDDLPVYVLSPKNIMENQLGSYVYVVDDKGKIKIKQIKIVYGTNQMLIINKKSLNKGDKVVVSATKKLREGMEVDFKEVKNPVIK